MSVVVWVLCVCYVMIIMLIISVCTWVMWIIGYVSVYTWVVWVVGCMRGHMRLYKRYEVIYVSGVYISSDGHI